MNFRTTSTTTPDAIRLLYYDDVENLFKNGDVIKEGSKQDVRLCKYRNRPFVIKSYDAKGIFQAFRILIRWSRPHNSMRTANHLRSRGILCPEHFMVVARYRPCSARAYLVMEYVSGLKFRDFFFSETPRTLSEETAQATINIIKSFHELGMTHGDLHAQNLIVQDDLTVQLIDLDNVRKARHRQNKDTSRFKASIAKGNQNTEVILRKIEEQLSK